MTQFLQQELLGPPKGLVVQHESQSVNSQPKRQKLESDPVRQLFETLLVNNEYSYSNGTTTHWIWQVGSPSEVPETIMSDAIKNALVEVDIQGVVPLMKQIQRQPIATLRNWLSHAFGLPPLRRITNRSDQMASEVIYLKKRKSGGNALCLAPVDALRSALCNPNKNGLYS
jgi:hypothetical protein